jgi:hypothetical protein
MKSVEELKATLYASPKNAQYSYKFSRAFQTAQARSAIFRNILLEIIMVEYCLVHGRLFKIPGIREIDG